jgi:hypothetical protein
VRKIVKATSLARDTVRKYLRIDRAEAPKYRRAEGAHEAGAVFVKAVQQALLADAWRPKKERGNQFGTRLSLRSSNAVACTSPQ